MVSKAELNKRRVRAERAETHHREVAAPTDRRRKRIITIGVVFLALMLVLPLLVFIGSVAALAGAAITCDLMLDINNIVVNSINHDYDAHDFLYRMPAERIRYFHLAGHYVEAPDLRIDTHGDAVDEQAWALLRDAYAHFGPVPTLLERDFNFPPLEELLDEVRRIRRYQDDAGQKAVSHG